LVTLFRELDSESTANEINGLFQKLFFDNPSGELSRSLEQLLQNAACVNSKPIRVLKAFNQSIVAPAIYRLKLTVGKKLPYKDVRGGWKVYIEINDDEIIVANQKWEQGSDVDSFQFSWKLDIVLDKELTTVKDVRLKVVDIVFGLKYKEPAQQQLLKEVFAQWL